MKSSFRIDSNYKYDLEKTNSIISPYVGILEFNLSEDFYSSSHDRAGAIASSYIYETEPYKYIIKFVPNKSKWNILSGKYFRMGEWVEMKPDLVLLQIKCRDKLRP